jgi:uncharacterized protein
LTAKVYAIRIYDRRRKAEEMRKRVRRLANVKNPPEAWLAGIREYVMSIFRCGAHSIHGPSHWQRVDEFGLNISKTSGADLTVVRLFALLHDSCRQDDGADLDHGPRAAEMLERIVPYFFTLDQGRFDLLKEAIRLHTSGLTTNDPTIGTCWDADRLDIGRVGMTPSPQYMSTEAGKDMAAMG